MLLNYPELVYKHPAYLASPVWMYSEKVQYRVEPPRTYVKGLYTPCYLGIMWFSKKGSRSYDVLDLPRTIVHKHPAHLASL